MKSINLILMFMVNITICSSQNNLIHNAGFETAETGKSDSPCRIAQADNLDIWEDDHNFVYANPFDFCFWLDCSSTNCFPGPCKKFHTPDWWFDQGLIKERFSERTCTQTSSGCVNDVPGHTGFGYIGMRAAELIEQNFFNSNPIEGGKRYTFSMYIRIPHDLSFSFDASNNPLSGGSNNSALTYNQQSQFQLSVYLATSKIKYQDGILTCSMGDEGDDKKDLTNNIVKLNTFTISPLNFPYLQWHKITFEFICPTTHEWDWIAIEQGKDMNNSDNNGYILIDDISLIKSCELSCYPTSGIPSPLIGTPTTGYNVPLQISNLDNVEKARVQIYPINGQNPIYDLTYQYTNGINQNIYWNAIGDAAATYICKLTCDNECGSFEFSQQFVNVGSSSPYPFGIPQFKIEEKQIYSCCLLDYTISNSTLNNSHYYKPRNNIYVNNTTFNINSNTSLVAGEQIEVLDETGTSSASEVSIYIEDCPDSHRYIDNVLTDKDFVFYEEAPISATATGQLYYDGIKETSSSIKMVYTELDLNEIKTFPNPTNESLNVLIPNNYFSQEIKYELYDCTGKLIRQFANTNSNISVDVSGLSSGIYTISMKTINSSIKRNFVKE